MTRHPSPVTIRCEDCGLLATDTTAAVAARRADMRYHGGRRLCPTCRPTTPRRKAR